MTLIDMIVADIRTWIYNERPAPSDHYGSSEHRIGYLDGKEDTLLNLEDLLATLKSKYKADPLGNYERTNPHT